jgi:hypothetical protein
MSTSNKNPLLTAFLFFLLLEFVHVPLGLYFRPYHGTYAPQDGKDFLVMPILVSVYYLFLLFFVKRWNSEFILGMSHIVFWLPWLIWEWIDPSITNCINCERFSEMLNIVNGCISSPFFFLLEVRESLNQGIWVFLNLFLMASYLAAIANLARYIAKRLEKRSENKPAD